MLNYHYSLNKYMLKKGSTLLLKLVILLITVVIFTGLIYMPQTEGRAKDLDLISIYKDPFIIYIYIAFIPFFVGLYQTFKILGYIEENKAFSQNTVKSLRNIKKCALIFMVFIVAAASFIAITVKDDDPAGFIALCIITTVASLIVATGSTIFANLIQKRIKK